MIFISISRHASILVGLTLAVAIGVYLTALLTLFDLRS
jgi:hypothetical protein